MGYEQSESAGVCSIDVTILVILPGRADTEGCFRTQQLIDVMFHEFINRLENKQITTQEILLDFAMSICILAEILAIPRTMCGILLPEDAANRQAGNFKLYCLL